MNKTMKRSCFVILITAILTFSLLLPACKNHWMTDLTADMYCQFCGELKKEPHLCLPLIYLLTIANQPTTDDPTINEPIINEPIIGLTHITADYTGTKTLYTYTLLNSLKNDLTVTAFFDDGTNKTLGAAEYALTGTLTVGTSVITALYGGQTTVFTVTVTPFTVANADDLRNIINDAEAGAVIALPGSDININSTTSIDVVKEITITTPPGENARLNRPNQDTFPVIRVRNGGKLILEGNGGGTLTVSGAASLTTAFIRVDSGGELLINQGVDIIGPSDNGNYRAIVIYGKAAMTGGMITGFNRIGAVNIADGGTFDMSGGIITGNASSSVTISGGVSVVGGGAFTMSGNAEISGNYTSLYGAGVYVNTNGTFTMLNGTIRNNYTTNNATDSRGGGVHINDGGVFTKTNGIIYGMDAWNTFGTDGKANWNRFTDNPSPFNAYAEQGYAVYWNRGAGAGGPRFRDSTAGAGDGMSTAAETGWE